MIKIFFIIMIILIVAIIIFISYKLRYILSFNQKFSRIFGDISVMTNRYALIYYYFNTLRTLILLPDNTDFKIRYINAMDNINEVYELENNKYLDLLSSNIGDYKEINKLFNVLKEANEDKFNEIKKAICNGIEFCDNYMESNKNLLILGTDFAYKSLINEISNIYMDYKKIKNKEDIEEIKTSLLFPENSLFINIGVSLNDFFGIVIKNIFVCFEKDEMNLHKSYINMMNYLNFFSIIISILIFIFIVFFIFIYISQFSEPIKEATYRINCSFFYIKRYSLTLYKKFDSNDTK